MKFFAWFNVLGILALAVLCAFQWKENRDANLRAVSLDKTCQEQADKLKGCLSDLDGFREQQDRCDADLAKAEAQAASLRSERDQLASARDRAVAERDQVADAMKQSKAIVDKWAAAVNERDESIKKAIGEINTLAKERNDAIAKFNELAEKYNALVKDTAKGAGR